MVIIISTQAVKNRFFTALSQQLAFDKWLTPKQIPYDKNKVADLASNSGIKQGTVIIFSKYGEITPNQFPPICTSDLLISLFFYKTPNDISNWIKAIGSYNEGPNDEVLVLGMMKPFYIKWAGRVYDCLSNERYGNKKTSKHLPDNTTKVELAYRLSKGCTLAIYVGHGRSRGWSGYRGFRWSHISRFDQTKPIGTMISLSCSSVKQDKTESIPMGIQWVMDGRNCVFIGSTESVKIRPLENITRILLDSISVSEIKRVDQLILQVNDKIRKLQKPDVSSIWDSFRLIGNPLQTL